MTPRDWLGFVPDHEVIIHEVGHLSVGLMLRLNEGGIQFIKNPITEVACAHWNSNGASNEDGIIRGLGGMFCQAIRLPSSIEAHLLEKIQKRRLFSDPSSLDRSGSLAKAMNKNGFIGDWISILQYAEASYSTKSKQLVLLNLSMQKLSKLMLATEFEKLFNDITADISHWLITPDDDLPFSDMLFYPFARASSIYINMGSPSWR